jgi:hypothetical protein
MNVIRRILEELRPIPGFRIQIRNPPQPDLVIEDTCRTGPNALRVISVSHCVERRGEMVFTPEMLFELKLWRGSMELKPFYLRDESVPVEGYSSFRDRAALIVIMSLQQEHQRFACEWNAQLEQQGIEQAFRSQIPTLLAQQYSTPAV